MWGGDGKMFTCTLYNKTPTQTKPPPIDLKANDGMYLVCVCAFGCCFVGANGCIPLTMLVGVCQCCCLLMFVCLPLSRHFPCCKTW